MTNTQQDSGKPIEENELREIFDKIRLIHDKYLQGYLEGQEIFIEHTDIDLMSEGRGQHLQYFDNWSKETIQWSIATENCPIQRKRFRGTERF